MLDNRFWSKVDKTETCWNWTGAKIQNGYGSCRRNGKSSLVHRMSYEYFKGKITNGLTIDHLCRNTSCVNPEHLEVVTMRENALRGNTIASKNAKKTHCPKGHQYTLENTWFYKRKGTERISRQCKTCDVIRKKQSKELEVILIG